MTLALLYQCQSLLDFRHASFLMAKTLGVGLGPGMMNMNCMISFELL